MSRVLTTKAEALSRPRLTEMIAKEICSALGEGPNAPDHRNGFQPLWMRYEEAARAALMVCERFFAPDSER